VGVALECVRVARTALRLRHSLFWVVVHQQLRIVENAPPEPSDPETRPELPMALMAVAEEIQVDVPQVPPNRQVDALEKVDIPDSNALAVVVAKWLSGSCDDADGLADRAVVSRAITNHVAAAHRTDIRSAIEAQ
jgi:hypothetical protein